MTNEERLAYEQKVAELTHELFAAERSHVTQRDTLAAEVDRLNGLLREMSAEMEVLRKGLDTMKQQKVMREEAVIHAIQRAETSELALTDIADMIIASFPFGGFACVQLSTVEQLKNIARMRLGRTPASTDPVPMVEETPSRS